MLGNIVMTKDREEGKRLSINRGVELMLRKSQKKKEDLKVFQIGFEKTISFFSKELYFQIKFNIKRK